MCAFELGGFFFSQGDFVGGKYEGVGTWFDLNGWKYCGGWRGGIRHGVGTFISPDGKTQHESRRENGQAVPEAKKE